MAKFIPAGSVISSEAADASVLRAAVIGLGAGFVSWLLARGLNKAITHPLFCADQASWLCEHTHIVSFSIATLAVSTIALLFLVRAAVYRPLLVVIASVITLWGLHDLLLNVKWFEASAWLALSGALAYAAYAWFARSVSFGLALVMIVLGVFISRLIVVL